MRTNRFRLFSTRGAGVGVLAVMVAGAILLGVAAGVAALLTSVF